MPKEMRRDTWRLHLHLLQFRVSRSLVFLSDMAAATGSAPRVRMDQAGPTYDFQARGPVTDKN